MQVGIFWDLDGTILSTGGQGWPCMLYASRNETTDSKPQDVSGLSDVQILSKLSGVEASLLDSEVHNYLSCLAATLTPGRVSLLPGAVEALLELREGPFKSAIVTGNLFEGARIKLSSAGILPQLDSLPIFGASQVRHNREEIAKHALEFLGIERAIFVGDSLNDVETAIALGMPCVAVATGHHSAQELHDAGAVTVLSQGYLSSELLAAIHSHLTGLL